MYDAPQIVRAKTTASMTALSRIMGLELLKTLVNWVETLTLPTSARLIRNEFVSIEQLFESVVVKVLGYGQDMDSESEKGSARDLVSALIWSLNGCFTGLGIISSLTSLRK